MKFMAMAFLITGLFAAAAVADNGSRTGEIIYRQVTASGATDAASTNYALKGTAGQSAVGVGASTSYDATHGYWTGATAGCCANRGNADGVIGFGGPVDVGDLTFLVAFLFGSGAAPPCEEEGNADAVVGFGGPIDVGDLTFLVAFLFGDGPASPPCT